jgi:hypothetical protein
MGGRQAKPAVTTKIGERIGGNSSKAFEKGKRLESAMVVRAQLRQSGSGRPGYDQAAIGTKYHGYTTFQGECVDSSRVLAKDPDRKSRTCKSSNEKHRNPNAPERTRLTERRESESCREPHVRENSSLPILENAVFLTWSRGLLLDASPSLV